MNILRKLLGNDAVISKPVPAAPPAALALTPAEKEAALRAEIEGADTARLTDIALTGKRAALRLLAAEALATQATPRDTWEAIAHTWADKDRRLSRLAREHIAAFTRQADLDARAATLSQDFSALMEKPSIDLTRLIQLDTSYELLRADALKADALKTNALEAAPTNALAALSALRAKVGTRLEAGQDAQRQMIAIEREADAARLALVAQQTVADPLVHAALAERFTALDASAVPAVIVARTAKALSALEQLVQSALMRGAAELTCRELIARINTLDPQDAEARTALEADIVAAQLPQDLLVRAKDAYDIHTGGADAAQRAAERDAQEAARATAKDSRNAQRDARQAESKAAQNALLALISETEAHLAAGEAKAAIKAASAIKLHRGEAEHLAPALRARFHAVESEVLKLEGFSRDMARTRRATLMERARKLPELTLNIDMLRSEVQTLQNDWKALDVEAGGAPRKLWDEFHTLTNKAYETVTLYRAVKAAERDEHLKLKEAKVIEIEALATALAAENPDWNKLAAKRGELVRQWYDQGGVGRKEQKALQVRMDAAVKAIDKLLDAERGRERTRRRALIDQVEAARVRAETERPTYDSTVHNRPRHGDHRQRPGDDHPWPALADAMKIAQDCQKQWNQRVSPLMLPRKEEQTLWDNFRALGNTVFEMRSLAREAAKVKQGAEREQHQLQITAVRALTQEAERAAVQTRLTEMQGAWRQSASHADRDSERKFDDAVQSVKAHLASLKRQDERSVWDALLDLDALLHEAEQQPGDTDMAARVDTLIPKLDPKHAAHPGITARKAAALQGKPVTSKLQRADVLLDLELALGIPAQPGEEAARRMRQMVLLSTTFKDRGVKREPREMLLGLIALPGSTARARLEAVIIKL